MRLYTLLLPTLWALLAEACTSELDCDSTYNGNAPNSTNTRSLRKRVTPTVLQQYKTWNQFTTARGMLSTPLMYSAPTETFAVT